MSRTQDLAKVLPPLGQHGAPIGDAARAVLRLVLERPISVSTLIDIDARACPNCGESVDSARSPYCGTECREIAGFVRNVRSGLREGTLQDPDRQLALGQILWRILGGGLPYRNSLITEKDLARLFRKYDGLCVECGAPATTVDHIESRHCNRTGNLRPKCDACAETKPFGAQAVLNRPETQTLLDDLGPRIASEVPLRPCDDAETWDWRAYVAQRKE
ncbi:hypothetical protein EON82_16845 [bacterium]|nr:MAG: hypothetical protein EON82_16845 [bacterium]